MAPKNMKDEVQLYRKIIAKYAAAFVLENDTIPINTSSNAFQILEYVECNNATVIINSGKAIVREYCSGVNVVLTGEKLRRPKDAMVGDFTLRSLQHIYAKKAFVGCSGIGTESGMIIKIFDDTDEKAFDDVLNAIREKDIQVYQIHKSDFQDIAPLRIQRRRLEKRRITEKAVYLPSMRSGTALFQSAVERFRYEKRLTT